MADTLIYKRPYLETSTFIALIKGETADGVDRAEVIRKIFENASNGRWSVFTSVFTIAEVLRDRNRPILTEEEEQRIDDFFKHDYIKLLAVDRGLAEHARKLARTHNLRPADAIHLASAIRARADEFLTWDKDFPKITIEAVTIKEPYWFGQTSMLYDS